MIFEHAINTSALTAALVLVGLKKAEWDERLDRRGYPAFLDRAWSWIINEIRLCQHSKTKSDTVVISEINSSLDRAFIETNKADIEAELSKARDNIWDALIKQAGSAPDDFEALFYGRQDGEPSWALLFVAFIREALKTNPRAETAFVTTRLAEMTDLVRTLEARIGENIERMVGKESELFLIIKQNAEHKAALDNGERPPSKVRFFDAATRKLMLSKLSIYKQAHQINLKTLTERVAEHAQLPPALLVRDMKRFMANKGIRVDDSVVALFSKFTDTLPNPSLPCVKSYGIDIETRFEFAVNDRAEAIVFHNRKFRQPIAWLELNSNTSVLTIVIAGGVFTDFQIPIRPEVMRYMRRAHRALLVLMDEETGEPIEGDYVALTVRGDALPQ